MQRQRHSAPGAALAFILVFALSACGTTTTSPSSDAASEAPPPGSEAPESQAPASAAAPTGDPIVIGSTLSLTGPFAATAGLHQIAGEMFVERLNASGGLLGRPVEWQLLDDESVQENVGPLYDRLITQEGVDLIIGPYATPNIIAAMGAAERHGYVMPQHTAVHALLMTYECQFPAWSLGPEPNVFMPNELFDALETLDNPPESIVAVTNAGGSTDFITRGLADDPDDPGLLAIAEERGIEVLADIPYPPGNAEWGPIAQQVADANPDAVIMNSLGIESASLIEAMEQLDYRPPIMFSLFPAPGPLLGLGEAADGHLSVSVFEPNESLIDAKGDEVRAIVEEFQSRAEEAGLPYTAFETQATSSWTAWEILAAGVEAAGSLDQEAICDALHTDGADTTFHGHLTFDPDDNNFWPSDQGIKQIQDGDWVMVWPEDIAAAELRGP
ncbi:MAG TPA: amino acid ABC transporter substrate-binding protein [Candidatus Limnocylindria bacterium]|nr:amino acid ABC transporter substrate-binding protein [Candidatus Limnocylindria bacterium]